MEGYNTVSMMGEGVEATIQDRIDTINETLKTKDSEILEDRKTELTNLLNTVQGDKEGQITDQDLAIATGIEAADEEPSPVSAPVSVPVSAPVSVPVPAHISGGGGNGGGSGQAASRSGGGSQQAQSGGSSPSGGWGGGWGWAEGGLIRKKYGSGGIVDLI